jgi:hypothetical protein
MANVEKAAAELTDKRDELDRGGFIQTSGIFSAP